jgi:hypothetical protein
MRSEYFKIYLILAAAIWPLGLKGSKAENSSILADFKENVGS